MTKFNEFEQYLIKQAMTRLQADMVQEIQEAERQGHRHLFHESYPPMVIKELLEKVDDLTVKSKK